MHVIDARFLKSGVDPNAGTGWPEEGPPEVAFIGRSNVGKSTLLAALTGKKGLVRTSSTPGRTRLINFFELDVMMADHQKQSIRFVDLPGFGYAKVSKSEREAWRPFVEKYLEGRKSLRACVLLVDARREVDDLFDESELRHWLDERGIHVISVMTKSDKLSKHERKPAAERVRKAIGGPPPLIVSATDGEGLDTLWYKIEKCLHPEASG